jgi:hypothetical protein
MRRKALAGDAARSITMNSNSNVFDSPTARKTIELKWKRVLRALVQRPHLNRFEAETAPDIRDHCLNSTIPEIERKGVQINRRQVRLHGYGGAPVFCAEYSLDDENRERAQKILAGA